MSTGQSSLRRTPLSRERIVRATLALADREGARAVSMRRIGKELGVEGMALYGYFRGKEQLLGAVAARVLDELDLDAARKGPWQSRIRSVIAAWVRLKELHPGGFVILYQSRDWAPQELAPIEEILDALHGAGFSPPRAALAYQSLVWLLDGVLLHDAMIAAS